jgi:hypothetical protein
MDQPVKVFTICQPDIQEFLVNNHVDLSELLRNEGYAVEKEYGSDPTSGGTKDVVSIILASSALAAVLQPVLKRIVEGLLNRPVRVTEMVPVAVESSHGKGADKSNKPTLVWVERTKLLEPTRDAESVKLSASFVGFKFAYESSPKNRK